jgi:hypothetical protein
MAQHGAALLFETLDRVVDGPDHGPLVLVDQVVVAALVARVGDLLPGAVGLFLERDAARRIGGVLVLHQHVQGVGGVDGLEGAGGLAVDQVDAARQFHRQRLRLGPGRVGRERFQAGGRRHPGRDQRVRGAGLLADHPLAAGDGKRGENGGGDAVQLQTHDALLNDEDAGPGFPDIGRTPRADTRIGAQMNPLRLEKDHVETTRRHWCAAAGETACVAQPGRRPGAGLRTRAR